MLVPELLKSIMKISALFMQIFVIINKLWGIKKELMKSKDMPELFLSIGLSRTQ